jgi:protein-tyrosine kinase
MSNIFDALKKNQVAAPQMPKGGEPFPVRPAAQAPAKGADIPYRAVRELEVLSERVESELPRTGRRVFVVAGAVTGEGASTISLQLTRTLARKGDGKVLLIDGDTSRVAGTLSQSIGQAGGLPGLAEVLGGQVELSKAVLSTDEPNLHFLPMGQSSIAFGDAAVSAKMREFLDDMATLYRVVAVDCPAILNHPESRNLAALTDGAVVVVRAHRTRREVVQKALVILQGAHVRVLGVVLNRRHYPVPEFLYRRL